MSLEPTSLGPHWWVSLNHGGLLIAPPIVKEFFDDDLEPLSPSRAEILRRALTRRAETSISGLLDTVFLQTLGYDQNLWNRNPPADKWSRRLLTGESERPRRLYEQPEGSVFPIFTEKPEVRLGLGRGRQSVARVVEWLRKSDLKLALLATEQQWRLIYAGSDFEAWCEWNLDLWFEAGQPAAQIEALRRLLDPRGVPVRLLNAIQDSRRGQAELTSALGERVREAVEKLIQASATNLENVDAQLNDIYLAATRIIMRCVVALFAEGKGMLGRDMPAYHDSYGVDGLRQQLERLGHGRLETLNHTQFAWPRLVSLFRLIHSGSAHPQLTVTRYGGTLFEPGNTNSHHAVLRAIAAFEKTHPCPRDRDVYEILSLLTRTYVKVSQGRGARVIATPVDFSNLDTEYIGILYEGLLDYDLKRADETVVFVRMGDEPALRVSDLETIPPGKLKDVFGKLQKKSQLSVSEDGEDSEESEEDDTPEEVDDESAAEAALPEPVAGSESAEDAHIRQAHRWAVDAVKAAGIVRAPRRQTAEALRNHEREVEAAARNLFSRIVRPGDWYLVRFGNTRKGSGTFYTRKELASPTVRRTLAPLTYAEDGNPKKPEEILALKVCDPAVGSGSFLISALRHITEALFQSLYVHGRIHESGGNKFYDLGNGQTEYLPDTEDFDDRLRARLRRHVVERCLYGVDFNPLAIELARMSLWIETLDPRLPFGFLDHKLKPGNALVGCWFDRFEDYPVMAWMREGGDKEYEPVNPRANWTRAIAKELKDRVKPSLVRMIETEAQQHLQFTDGKSSAEVCAVARERLNAIHGLSVTDPDRQRDEYEKLRGDTAFRRLEQAFDTWCALWFWPADELRKAPIAADFLAPSEDALRIVDEVKTRFRFFHWELEFPDVFTSSGSGFDAIIGNPPWEIQKPNSREFFSNIDPLYRSYGKNEALRRQKEYFRHDPRHEQDWIVERSRLKALSNWVNSVSLPSGDHVITNKQGKPEFSCALGSRFAASQDLHTRWKRLRAGRRGYADKKHPFLHQGSADLNTYKMFLEAGYRLLRNSGRLGMVAPSGIYSDEGSTVLRTLFLVESRWEWLFGFENRQKIFEIDSRFKFNPLVVQKGGGTETIHAAFMHHALRDWDEAEQHGLSYPGTRVTRFSPTSKALLEIRSERDLAIAERFYSNGRMLSDHTLESWRILLKREFHMTDDVKAGNFLPRRELEARGYLEDQYGYWLKGAWKQGDPKTMTSTGVTWAPDFSRFLSVGLIEEIALPVYQGVMIHSFVPTAAQYVYGPGGSRGSWKRSSKPTDIPKPQFLMKHDVYTTSDKRIPGLRLLYRAQARATDERTMIGCLVPDLPFGHSLNALWLPNADIVEAALSVALFSSLAHDWIIRQRVAGANVCAFQILESVWPEPTEIAGRLSVFAAKLNLAHARFSRLWISIRKKLPEIRQLNLTQLFAISDLERLRIRCLVDAVVAVMYGLNGDDFRHMLRDCDYPESTLADKSFARTLDPKGFWRVDKEKPPHLRHTVLSLVAFHELERIGLDAFLALNDGEGWMLPEKLRLADYGLGHDDRAKEYQPVASVLGPRFYDWQLAQSVEESWEECERHAELLAKIVPPPPEPEEEPQSASISVPDGTAPTDLFGNPVPTDLFGNPVYTRKRR